MDNKAKVREAQRLIIDRLAQSEEAIAELYAAYSNTFQKMADFWCARSDEEKDHARLLESLGKLLDKGNIFYDIGRFSTEAINDHITTIRTELAAVRESSVSLLHALKTAFFIEISIMDAHFYEIVTSDAPEFKKIAEHLSKATKCHIELIQEQLKTEQSEDRMGLYTTTQSLMPPSQPQ